MKTKHGCLGDRAFIYLRPRLIYVCVGQQDDGEHGLDEIVAKTAQSSARQRKAMEQRKTMNSGKNSVKYKTLVKFL